jgi:hypothetical protein
MTRAVRALQRGGGGGEDLRIVEDRLERPLHRRGLEYPERDLLAAAGRDRRYAEVDLAPSEPHAEPPVLRQSPLGHVEAASTFRRATRPRPWFAGIEWSQS